ncbi:hypothetical protein GPA22_22105 [Aromatoleum toluvorans]|uniref:Mor transcription activator domain-containing protein n=1 Tax=Aromatoleum toluvorans TaxID=92002 RepID=A0ABX1Q7G2_9RHOO|nr:hypothetical protein [Aromatoleum toluvorans]
MKISRKSGHEVLSHFAAMLSALLLRKGVEEKAADDISVEALDTMTKEFGGQQIYFPRDFKRQRDDRDSTIFERFQRNEASIDSLAYEYGISARQVYSIIAAERERRRREREDAEQAARAKELARWKREKL